MRTLDLGLVVALCAALAGCANRQSVTRIDDSTYLVQQTTGTIDSTRIRLMYRAASMTLEHGYDLMLIESLKEKQKPESYVRSDRLTRSMPLGWDARQTVMSTTGDSQDWRPKPLPGGAYRPVTLIEGRAVVSMYRKPLPDTLMAAIDARELKARLQPFFDTNGQAQLPEMWKLVRQSTLTHVHISLPTANVINPEFAEPPPKLSIAPAKDLRDASEFVDQFEAAESEIYGWYDWRRRDGGAGGGTVTLSLTVSPLGLVTDCRVVSATVADAVFVDGLRRMARKFRFFREEVVSTRAAAIPIEFTPRR